MLGLLDPAHWLVTVLVAVWGLGVLGVVVLVAALLREDARVVAGDPHEEAIFDAVRARRWDDGATELGQVPVA